MRLQVDYDYLGELQLRMVCYMTVNLSESGEFGLQMFKDLLILQKLHLLKIISRSGLFFFAILYQMTV